MILQLRFRCTQQPVFTMLVIAKRQPEANNLGLASRRDDNGKRVEFSIASHRAKKLDLGGAGLPARSLGPIEEHRTVAPTRQPCRLNIILPIGTVGIHQEQVLALWPVRSAKAASRPGRSPRVIGERDKCCKHKRPNQNREGPVNYNNRRNYKNYESDAI